MFENRRLRPDDRETWVFVGGDGNAWLRDGRVAEDPTPTVSLGLALLARVDGHALFIGRPCTFGTIAHDPACRPAVWTVERYSAPVVESMAAVVARYAAGDRAIVLVGYSGGGVIAVHLANRLDRVKGLLTLAANLDVGGWAAHHGYTEALAARSLPLDFPPRAALTRLYVFGANDQNAPRALAARLLEADPAAAVRVLPGVGHERGWLEAWPPISAELQQLMAAAAATRASSSAR